MSQVSLDMDDPQAHPYFLWSEDLTVSQLRRILAGAEGEFLRTVYLGRLLREARIGDVWKFVSPQEVAARWSSVAKHLGRRKRFWQFLLDVWREHGLIGE